MSNEETATEETAVETVVSEIDQAFKEMATEEAAIEETTTEQKIEEVTDAPTEETAEEATEATEATDALQAEGSRSEEASLDSTPVAISDDLLMRAAGVGLSLTDARTFSSDAALERFLDPMEAVQAEAIEDDEAAGQTGDPFADLPKLDPEIHDAGVIEKFDRLVDIIRHERETNQAVEDRLQAIEGQQLEVHQATEANRAAETNSWFDKQISGLGEDFTEVLGAGKTTLLDQAGSQFTKREELARQTAVLISGYQAEGLESPPRDELFATAAKLVLQEEYQQIREKKLSGNLEKRASQHIERAGGRKADASQTPMEFAASELERTLGIAQ